MKDLRVLASMKDLRVLGTARALRYRYVDKSLQHDTSHEPHWYESQKPKLRTAIVSRLSNGVAFSLTA